MDVVLKQENQTYTVIIVVPQDPRNIRRDKLVRCRASDEGAVHVNIVTAKIKCNETLEDDCTSWIGSCKKTQQA